MFGLHNTAFTVLPITHPRDGKEETTMRLTASEVLDYYKRDKGDDALRRRDIPAIALAIRVLPGFDINDPMTLTEKCVTIEPVMHPVISALLKESTAFQVGAHSFAIGMGEDSDYTPVSKLGAAIYPNALVPAQLLKNQKGPARLFDSYGWHRINALNATFAGTPIPAALRVQHASYWPSENDYGPLARGAIALANAGTRMFMTCVTHWASLPEGWTGPKVDLNLRAAGRAPKAPKAYRPSEIARVAAWAASVGYEVLDYSEQAGAWKTIRTMLDNAVVAWPLPGKPALAAVSVGLKTVGVAERLGLTAEKLTDDPWSRLGAMLTQADAGTLERLSSQAPNVIISPAVADVGALANAEPWCDPRLLEYQQEIVGRTLATRYGLANVIPPGRGKTITTLVAVNERAKRTPGYRCLIVTEANVRDQWAGKDSEAERWVPDLPRFVIGSRADVPNLEAALAAAGDGPLLVLTSYSLVCDVLPYAEADGAVPAHRKAVSDELTVIYDTPVDEDDTAGSKPATPVQTAPVRTAPAATFTPDGQGELFTFDDNGTIAALTEVAATEPETVDSEPVGTTLGQLLWGVERWHDLVVDEAVVFKNTSSRQAQSLWALRGRADVAIGLTGTPIERGVDDLGKLLAWVRNDRELFHGAPLSKQFDLTTDEGVEQFAAAVGPLLYRASTDGGGPVGKIPTIKSELVMLEPTPDEAALSKAAQHELRRVYLDLCSWMEQLEGRNPDDPEIAEVREALNMAKKAWMGGTLFARQAASDPAALLESKSAAVALLDSQGLLAPALDNTATKRAWAVEYCRTAVAEGGQVLIFTDFARVATVLYAALVDAGFQVGQVIGGGGKARDRMVKEFRQGDLDILVCTSSGERGLNLQNATHLVHYDLPWLPTRVTQRTGRIARIGSPHDEVKVVFPLMAGTIEERVAAIVVARAVESMRALDASRGVSIEDTDFGRSLSGLVENVDASWLGTAAKPGTDRNAAMLELTKFLVS